MVKASEPLECRILVAESIAQSRVCLGLRGIFMRSLSSVWGFIREAWILGKKEPVKLIHGLKVGIALSLVSLFYYMRPLYDGVGGNAMWAILTVAVVFEYTVGATLSKCLEKAVGTLLAVALGIGVHWLSSQFREKFEPVILQGSVCIISAAATFSRFLPSIKTRFDYAALVFILTFTLVSVSGYREIKMLEFALHRLSTIALGTSMCIVTSMLLCPVWAGNELHYLIKSNMENIADSLDGCTAEYFRCDANANNTKSETSKYKCVLDSRDTEESLARFARLEPTHGDFDFGHPWKEYLKVGALLRSFAYYIEALNGIIGTDTQAPDFMKKNLSKHCIELSSNSSAVLKESVVVMDTMTKSAEVDIKVLQMCNAVQEVQNALKALSQQQFASSVQLVTIASLLIEIAGVTEKIAKTANGFADKVTIVQN